jgi:hypothetical protein
VAENKEVPDRNIGVPPVRKYAKYRTLIVGFTLVTLINFRGLLFDTELGNLLKVSII